MYNFPAVTGGIDLDTDLIEDIARSSSNVAGIKLTCGGVGKITRLTGLTKSKEFVDKYPRKQASAPYVIFFFVLSTNMA
jgi:L-threo-3-deoxy-hexylosonate aldolase